MAINRDKHNEPIIRSFIALQGETLAGASALLVVGFLYPKFLLLGRSTYGAMGKQLISKRKEKMENTQAVPKKPIYKRWWFWLVGIIVLFIIIGASSNGSSKQKDDQGKEPVQGTEAAKPSAMPVTAEVLMRDYQANEVAADGKYKNQTVAVSGVVDTIGKDILDNPYVSFKTGEVIFTIQCMFDKSQADQLASLSKGQKLTLQGKVSGKLGNIILKECKF